MSTLYPLIPSDSRNGSVGEGYEESHRNLSRGARNAVGPMTLDILRRDI